MSDESKPFEPTHARIQKARREGNVARAPELIVIASFGAGSLAAFALGPQFGVVGRAWIERLANNPNATPADVAFPLFALALVPLLCAAVAGTACSLVQSGGFTFTAPSVKFERMNPKENVKRMFSSEAAVSAIRAVLAFAAASAIMIPTANLVFDRASGGGSPVALGSLATLGAERAIASALAVAILFGTTDYLLARHRWRKKLRMSLYELKKDVSENEGNPQMRGRRRQRHRSLVAGSLASVEKAAFVVANPTHVAVALEYAPPDVPVPRVLVLAAEEVALRVRALASERGIPVVENVELARLLYATATVGKSIPRETFLAVAEIVTALGKARRSA